ncbi:Ig-like domain-containing protein [Alkaliphilus transvaalensis]|uniref:Ig-like domain-containing protein n=1 Tax=Alkaliphilus transvaalensis TaxID=114628 RepID=UPI001FA7AFA8
MTEDDQTLVVTDTLQLNAVVAPADATNKDVTWSSDNDTVATVDANGLVTAEAEGVAVITVTTNDGSFTATVEITVE